MIFPSACVHHLALPATPSHRHACTSIPYRALVHSPATPSYRTQQSSTHTPHTPTATPPIISPSIGLLSSQPPPATPFLPSFTRHSSCLSSFAHKPPFHGVQTSLRQVQSIHYLLSPSSLLPRFPDAANLSPRLMHSLTHILLHNVREECQFHMTAYSFPYELTPLTLGPDPYRVRRLHTLEVSPSVAL